MLTFSAPPSAYLHTALHPASAYVLLERVDDEILEYVTVAVEGAASSPTSLSYKCSREQWLACLMTTEKEKL